MGWKWNDIANLLRETGMFTEEQIAKVDEIVTKKKWELVSILETQIGTTPDRDRGRDGAFREVIAAVKPNGPRPE